MLRPVDYFLLNYPKVTKNLFSKLIPWSDLLLKTRIHPRHEMYSRHRIAIVDGIFLVEQVFA
jgi:hypothetical protein